MSIALLRSRDSDRSSLMDPSPTIAYTPDLHLSLALEPAASNDELFSFRPQKENEPDKRYRPSEQQLIQEGRLGDSELSARIKTALFGTFAGKPACLIHFQVDFCPKGGGRGWFRFRSATIEADFSDIAPGDGQEASDDDSDDDDGGTSSRPLVLRIHPDLIRGHIQTAAQKHGIKGIVQPAAAGVGFEVGVEKTFVREGLHLVHGRLVGDQTGAKWSMAENGVTSSGIYEQPAFVVVVRYEPDKGFAMRLKVEASTYGGLAVRGKRRPRVTFKRGKLPDSGELDGIDLEEMTGMRAKLLAREGPGGGKDAMGMETT